MPTAPDASAPRAPLSRERILDAALALADTHGLHALSMRRLGQSLGVEAMSLYNHVAGKDALLDALVDRVLAAIDVPSPADADWRGAMRRRAHSARAAFLAHRWALGLLESRYEQSSERRLTYFDAILGVLRTAGFSDTLAMRAFATLDAYIYGSIMQELALPFDDDAGLQEVGEDLLRQMAARYPHLTAVTARVMAEGYDRGEEFGFGLELLLDALDGARRAERRGVRGVPATRAVGRRGRGGPAALLLLPFAAASLAAASSGATLTAQPAIARGVPVDTAGPTVDSLHALLADRVRLGRNPGIVAVRITPEGAAFAAAGRADSPDGRPLDAATRFEIGSITKAVTGTLFAIAIARGEVRAEERLADALPGLPLPPGGDSITLLDLATHRSGLPSFPPGHEPADPYDPWADVSEAVVARALASLDRLRFPPGTRAEYSNVGAGLLGRVLVARAGADSFDALVQRRIAEPLGLTTFTTDPDVPDSLHMATGHDADGPVPRWHLSYLAAAGALVSTATDMTRFARACLGDGPPDVVRAIREARRPRRDYPPTHRIGLHWIVTGTPGGGEVAWHNGGTGGFRSWLGCDPASGRAAVVLSNGSASIDDLGFHLVDPSSPLRPPPPASRRETVVVDTSHMATLTGTYRIAPTFAITVTREGSALFAKATGQPTLPLLPDAPDRWRVRGVDASLEFERDADGRVVAVVLVQGGARQRLPRATP